MSLRFSVERTWDIDGRDGLLVKGRVAGGSIRRGMELRRAPSGGTVKVEGIELIDVPGSVTIIVDRSASWLRQGMVLTDAAALAS